MSLFTTLKRSFLLTLSVTSFAFAAKAQWLHSGGITGNVYSLVDNDTIIWAGTDTGGVYRSSNNGMTFTQVNNGIGTASKSVKALARKGGRLIAATSNLGGAFLLSDDNGDSWNPPSSNYFGYAFTLLVDGANIYAGTWYGVARSTTSGNSWSTLGTSGLPSNASVSTLVVNGSNIFAGVTASSGGGTGVFMSSNGGTSWTAKNNGLTNTNVTALANVSGVLYAGTAAGIFKSTDNGANWTAAHNGLGSLGILTLQVINGVLITGTANGIYKLDGSSWTNITYNLPSNTQVFAVSLNGGAVTIGTSDGVYTTPLSTLSASKPEAVQFNVYPNPSKGLIKVQLYKEYENMEMKLVNLLGQQVFSESISGSSQEFNFTSLPKGTYFLSIRTAAVTTQKLIVIE